MGFLTMKSPFLQNVNKANHAVDMFLRHHLQGLEAGDASNNSPGQLSFPSLNQNIFPRKTIWKQQNQPTSSPNPKKTIATITLAHSKLQIVLPQETNNKKQQHLSHHQNTPKKSGQTSS